MIRQQVFLFFFQSTQPEIIFSTITRNAININDLVNEYLLTLIFQGYPSNKTKNSSRNVLIYWIFVFFKFPVLCALLCLCCQSLPLFIFTQRTLYSLPLYSFDLLCLLIMVWRMRWFCIFFCFKWGIRLNAMYLWI